MDKIKEKVSIVLPVYNGESKMEKSIDSILRQTYSNLELLIVNDGSTDRTHDIAQSFLQRDKRVRLIENPVNLKLPGSLNAGFAQATGAYYTWTSDDNLYKEQAIEKMLTALQNHPETDMVYTDYTNIDAADRILGEVCLPAPEKLLFGNTVGACFLYTQKIAHKVGGYDTNLFLAEDYDYWIRIRKAGSILHMQDNLYFYRQHEKSLTETRKEEIAAQTFKTLEKHFLFLYSMAKTKKERYLFFEKMLSKLHGRDECSVRDMLLSIDHSYIHYERKEKLKRKLRGIRHGKRMHNVSEERFL